MAYERYYYMPMSVNADGDGPADERETARVLHEVWDDACLTLCTCSDEATARHVANLLNARPVAAPQQPAHNADAFRNMFAILHNLDRWELEEAGLIAAHDDDKWTRFNSNLTTFVLKLDDARLDKLYALVQERQPARYRH